MGSIKSLMLSGGTRVLSLPLTAVCSFASTGLIIDYAGPSGFAAISVVSTMFMLIQFSDLGLGSGVINAISSTRNERDDKIGVIASTFRMLCLVSVVLLILAWSGTSLFSWSVLLGIDGAALRGLDYATFAAISIFALALPFSVGQRILTGMSRNHVAILLSALTSVASLVMITAVYVFRGPPSLMSAAQSFGLLISAILSYVVATRAFKFRSSSLFLRRSYRATGLLGSGLWMLALSVCIAVTFQSGRLMVAHRSSSDQLAVYSLAMQFYLPIVSVVSASGFALWPIFSSKRGQDSAETQDLGRYTLFFCLAGSIFAAVFALLADPAARVLSGGQIQLSGPLVLTVCILIVLQSAQVVPGMFLTTREGLRFQAGCGLGGVLLSVPLSFALTPLIGASGPVVGTCVAVCFAQFIPTFLKATAQNHGAI